MAVCARARVGTFFVRYLPGFFQLFGKEKLFKKKYGSGRFSGSGVDEHQLIFLYGLRKKWTFLLYPIIRPMDINFWSKGELKVFRRP